MVRRKKPELLMFLLGWEACGCLRVQIVPGEIPFLLPAYLLKEMGSVIDMPGERISHTSLFTVQKLLQRATGRVV